MGAGYDLAIINDPAENQNLKITTKDDYQYWFGLKENGTEKYFSWINDISLEFGKEFNGDPWGEDEPKKVSLMWNNLTNQMLQSVVKHLV